MQRLKGDHNLIGSAIEEMLRYESPLQRGVFRVTTEPLEIGGHVISAGQKVSPVVSAPNRDLREFLIQVSKCSKVRRHARLLLLRSRACDIALA